MLHSLVEYYSEHERYKCGYCKKPDTNYSHGMMAHCLTVSDYQDLIDRGWRRSGRYCYKPTMDMTCCPMYTIRCEALKYKPTKSQKKILKKVNSFLAGQTTLNNSNQARKMSTGSEHGDEPVGNESIMAEIRESKNCDFREKIELANMSKVIDGAANNSSDEKNNENLATDLGQQQVDKLGKKYHLSSTSVSKERTSKVTSKCVKQGIGLDPTKAPLKKAKQLRLERKAEKLRQKGQEATAYTQVQQRDKEKTLEDFFTDMPESLRQRLKVRLVRTNPPSPEWLATAKESHAVFVKYQMSVHGDTLYKCTEPKFKNFLVDSPLEPEQPADGPSCGYGSFHQQYWLDDKLVAVGVIDILPKCISSVYFYYDPAFSSLTLGTYGAMQELSFTRELQTQSPKLQYYYMGFYIHSCPKMRYKGNYTPSQLLCPGTYKWFSLEESVKRLNESAYSRLNPDIDDIDLNDCSRSHLEGIPILLGQQTVMLYRSYKEGSHQVRPRQSVTDEVVLQYAKLVGRKAALSMILVV